MAKLTKRYKIGTPVPGFTGYIGVVMFANGWAEVEVDIDDDPFGQKTSAGVSRDEELLLPKEDALKLRVMRAAPAMAYFWPQGYIVEDLTPDVVPQPAEAQAEAQPAAKSAAKSKEIPA